MPTTIKEERLRWILPIYNKEIKLVDVVKVCPHSKRSLERWLNGYREYGESGLVPKSTRPKTNPNETPIRTKERIIELRKETHLCAKKLNYKLKKEEILIHDNTIHKIIAKEGLIRKYRTRKLTYKYIKVPLAKGELVEIDIKYVPGEIKGKKYYQFTAIDCSSRWKYLEVYDSFSNLASIDFLKELIKVAPFKIRSIKTDNASNFTNRYVGYRKSTDPQNPRLHPLDVECQRRNIIHYLIDPGKPQQNGKVERSHRTDQEMFYDKNTFRSINELRQKMSNWNQEYNNLEHCALNGKTPNEMIKTLTT